MKWAGQHKRVEVLQTLHGFLKRILLKLTIKLKNHKNLIKKLNFEKDAQYRQHAQKVHWQQQAS